ncbi:MAG: hypothetical protein Q9P44_10580 [Anaerolineae bacterium]|nr:hypothetical protein [Anaerolineae bacterium]
MSERENVRQKVLGTLLTNAILRWETFATLLITMILFIAVPQFNLLGIDLPSWFWLVLGGVAEGALIWSTLTDPEETQQAIAREFESQYDLAHVRNAVSRDRLKKAMEYRRNMMKLQKQRKGAGRAQFNDTITDVNDWIAAMYGLALHIDTFEGNALIESDMKSVPQQIEKVKIRIDRERDERVKGDLEGQLELLERQRLNLESTKNSIRRAEIALESTLSSLGTMYAQMSLLGTRAGGTDSSRFQRIRLEIKDEVNSLQDTIDAMEEVQSQSSMLHNS